MSGDYIRTKKVNVTVQANGIIRNEKGRILGRLDKEIEFDGEHMPPTKVQKVCKTCGSTDVWSDANSVWDEETQRWTLGNVFDHEWCVTCDAETKIVDKPI